jgi:hypothetical protein
MLGSAARAGALATAKLKAKAAIEPAIVLYIVYSQVVTPTGSALDAGRKTKFKNPRQPLRGN